MSVRRGARCAGAWDALKRAGVALIADLDAFLLGASSLQGSRLGRRDRLRLDDVTGNVLHDEMDTRPTSVS